MEDLCIQCRKRPIYVKKRGLCRKCYAQVYNRVHKNSCDSSAVDHYWKIRHSKEIEFIKNFFEHKNWCYQPAMFRLDDLRYTPDFYDGERNVFIEVAGTRQAFHSNEKKYKQFTKMFPRINFEVRYATGELIAISETGKNVFHNQGKR